MLSEKACRCHVEPASLVVPELLVVLLVDGLALDVYRLLQSLVATTPAGQFLKRLSLMLR